MEKHPIESLMGTSMESIREMVDVNTVVGDADQTQDGSTIIPISKVSFGFGAAASMRADSCARRNRPLRAERARAYPCSRWAFWCARRAVYGC